MEARKLYRLFRLKRPAPDPLRLDQPLMPVEVVSRTTGRNEVNQKPPGCFSLAPAQRSVFVAPFLAVADFLSFSLTDRVALTSANPLG